MYDFNKQPLNGKLTFWGEWEAQSKFKVISETSKDLEKLNEYINYQRLRFIQDLFEEFKNFSKQTFFQ